MIFNKTTTTLAPRINTALGNNLSISNKVNLTFNLDLHSLAFNSNKFYSTSLSPLVINSTPDNLVFNQNKAGLLLASIYSLSYVGDEIDSPFFEDLSKVYNNLEQGEYRLDFFLYLKSSNTLSVYNFNLSNDCLYSNLGTQGYFNFLKKYIEFESNSL